MQRLWTNGSCQSSVVLHSQAEFQQMIIIPRTLEVFRVLLIVLVSELHCLSPSVADYSRLVKSLHIVIRNDSPCEIYTAFTVFKWQFSHHEYKWQVVYLEEFNVIINTNTHSLCTNRCSVGSLFYKVKRL